MINSTQRLTIPALTGIRGVAALWVVLHHLMGRWNFIENDYGFISRIADRGWLGVDLFFILSGFVISYVHRDDFKGHISRSVALRFLALRIARIYPVHLVMTVAFVPVFLVANYLLSFDLGDTFSLSKFFYSIFLLNGWGIPNSAGWNGASWSVSSEWFAYLLFPAIALFLSKYKSALTGLFIIAATFSIAIFLALKLNNGTHYMLGEHWTLFRIVSEFLIGCALRNVFDYCKKSNIWDIIGIATLVITIAFCIINPSHFYDFVLIACFTVIILALSLATGPFSRLFASRLFCYLGKISYSLYLVHGLFILMLSKLSRDIFSGSENFELATQLLVALGFFGLVTFAAHLVYYRVEEPMRRLLKSKYDSRWPSKKA